jgi:tetratricopeptide (TPR) repeat protein
MSQQVEKLKKKAAEFEAKRQVDKAISTYLELFRVWDGGDASGFDVTLYNRVGDMLVRAGNVGDAVSVWEKAVDFYGDNGFHNNAIALCNKILRSSPGRTSIYYKLGKISAQKGFKGDAKKNYLEYADRMQKANNIDEAFRALKEFADLCPDDSDIRQMLADQLAKLGRNDEALEQLQLLYERYESMGESAAAAATVERMRSIDPTVEPKRSGPAGKRASSGLVFLDLDAPPQRTARKSTSVAPVKASTIPPKRDHNSAIEGLPLIDMSEPAAPPPRRKSVAAQPTPVEPVRVEPIVPEPPAPEPVAVEPLVIEHTIAEPIAGESIVVESLIEQPIVIEPVEAESILDPAPVADGVPIETTSMADAVQGAPTEFDGATAGELEPIDVDRDLIVADAAPTDATHDEIELVDLDELPQSIGAESPAEPAVASLDDFAAESAAAESAAAESAAAAATAAAAAADAEAEAAAQVEAAAQAKAAAESEAAARAASEAEPVPLVVAPPVAEIVPPVMPDVTFGASFGTDEGNARVSTPLGGVEPTTFDQDFGVEGAVSAALSSPEDVSFGTLGTGDFGLSDRAAPEMIEFMPGLDLTDPAELPPLAMDDAFALRDDLAGTPPVAEPAPEAPLPPRQPRRSVRPTMSILAQSVDLLRERARTSPSDWQLRRELGEALLEDGDRAGGIDQLEAAMVGFEHDDDLESARSVADEIIRLNPLSVRHHQRRVEYAFRMNDRPRLVEAYTELADALFREGQAEKSRVVYERVLELSPDDARALAALTAFGDRPKRVSGAFQSPSSGTRTSSPGMRRASRAAAPVQADEPPAERAPTPATGPGVAPISVPLADTAGAPAAEPVAASAVDESATELALDAALDAAFDAAPANRPSQPASPTPAAGRPTPSTPRAPQSVTPRLTPPSVVRASTDSEFVDLEDWLKEDERPKSTRMIVEEKPPTGDEAADFNDMLRKFKQGVARNVEDEDHESHYDLGVAYKEMGLAEEAIAEFQKALRGPKNRVRTYEALGQCFVEKGQEQVAMTILQRALAEPGAGDEQLIGVLYLLGLSAEVMKMPADAVKYYQRVFAVDINFRDVRARMRELEQAGR